MLKNSQEVELVISDTPVLYQDALSFMQKRVQQIISGEANQLLWFLQHQSVYTAGTSANENDLLKKDKFPVHHTGRGGKFTYHGPGQRVAYLMLDLKKIHSGKPDIKLFVKQIENWIIQSLKEVGIESYTTKEHVGVWVDNNGKEEKIAAIGVRVQKWVSFHGVAINVSTNLDDYNGIVPCGIEDKGITSINKVGKLVSIQDYDKILIDNFKTTFNVELSDKSN